MAASKTITIVGVTGNQGNAVANTFLQTPGWIVRGVTRSTNGGAAQQLYAAGVELMQADLDDQQSLVKAFRGSHVIYANTDFFALTKYPNLNELLRTTYASQQLNHACMQHEIQQGKNIVDAAAQILLKESRLVSFVLSTLSCASKWSHGEITNLLHFDSKAIVENYVKENHAALAAVTRYLQVGFYMSKTQSPFHLPKRGLDEVYEAHWPNIDLLTVLPAACPERDTGIFVRALADATPGTVLLGESDRVTVEEFLHIWSDVTGYPSRLKSMTTSEFEAVVEPVPPSSGKEFAENFQYYRDFTYTGRDPNVIKPAQLGIEKKDLTIYKQYLEGLDWNSLLYL